MMCHAVTGSFKGMAVFAMPGPPAAARLALTRLILPELGHAARELFRDRSSCLGPRSHVLPGCGGASL